MPCEVEYTDEFEYWWEELSDSEQRSVAHYVKLLQDYGVTLRHPYSSGITTSRHSSMRELRVQHEGRPYRVLYIFDLRRAAILLIGGDKTGDNLWYEKNVPAADKIYDNCLDELRKEQSPDVEN